MWIGQQSSVAIEYTVERILPSGGTVWIYGRFRLWLAGVGLGDREEEVTLNEVAALADHIHRNRDRRNLAGVGGLTAEELFSRIDGALYQDDQRDDDEVKRDAEVYGGTSAIPDVDVLQKWRGYLVRVDDDTERLVWRNAHESESSVHELSLRAGEFDDVLERFVASIRGVVSAS